MVMGTTYYTLAVFDRPWRDMLEKLSREFKCPKPEEDIKDEQKFVEIYTRKFRVVGIGLKYVLAKRVNGLKILGDSSMPISLKAIEKSFRSLTPNFLNPGSFSYSGGAYRPP